MATMIRGSRKGLTLIELLVSLSIFLVVLLAVYQLFTTSEATYVSGTRKQDAQQQARLAMDEMARSIRMAGYIPENFDRLAAAGNPLNDVNDVIGNARLAIRMATPQALALFGNLGQGTQIYLYCLYVAPGQPANDTTGVLLTKTGADVAATYVCDCPTAANPADCRTSGDILVNNIPVPNPPTLPTLFSYYGNNAAGSFLQIVPAGGGSSLDGVTTANAPLLGTQAERSAVQSVAVTLTVREAGVRQADADQRYMLQNQTYRLTSTINRRNPNPSN